ncbi:MAG: DMT family transporter [Candidatus Dadabacteria bacterium]|nr:MAG: DMT family transporter [Candidatus Dadabacteria bacterium]
MADPRVIALTAIVMTAFAGNSLLARAGLLSGQIGADAFTAIRLCSGAITLILLLASRGGRFRLRRVHLWTGLMLLVYAACFSRAYMEIDTATGALVLFAAVQLTMLGAARLRGEHFGRQRTAGIGLAAAAVSWLLWPGQARVSVSGVLTMAGSGLAWGFYSLAGRTSREPPLVTTTASFAIAAVPALVLAAPQLRSVYPTGAMYAVASGALTSALGYALWYAVLPRLSRTIAATVQLTVPVIAAAMGILILAEPLSSRLPPAATATLVGLWLATRAASPQTPARAMSSGEATSLTGSATPR